MRGLELKIPPPVVALILAAAMWAIAKVTPPMAIPDVVSALAAGALALAGFVLALSGVLAFRRAQTTIHPHKPQETSAFVTSGVYRFSRNPMYLGLLLILLAWAVFLSAAWSFVGPVAFVPYINRFQILPEERVLSTKFGEAYTAYKTRVRRWL